MKSVFAALLLSISLAAAAQPAAVKVERAWARSTVQGQDSTGAYMTITATEPLTLVGAANRLMPGKCAAWSSTSFSSTPRDRGTALMPARAM